jgi:hypothetical protein
MPRTGLGSAALIVLTLVNLADLISIGFVGTPGNPPVVIVPRFVLAVVGTIATVPAWRGRRTWVLVTSRLARRQPSSRAPTTSPKISRTGSGPV